MSAPIQLFRDTITVYGMSQYRVRAIRGCMVLHTTIRWHKGEADNAMRRWLSKNVALVEVYNVAN